MSETIFNIFKINMLHSFKFKYPKYTIITNIKINNLNIFSKILPKGKIAIYGDYQIIITYTNKISNQCLSKNLTKYKTSSFYKVFNLKNITKYGSPKNLKANMQFLSKPKCLYSIQDYLKPYYFSKDKNFCKIILFYSISIDICAKKIPYNNIRTTDNNNIVNEDIVYNDTVSSPIPLENLNNPISSKNQYIKDNYNSTDEYKHDNKNNSNVDYTNLSPSLLNNSNTLDYSKNKYDKYNKQNNDYKNTSNKLTTNSKNSKTSSNKNLKSTIPIKNQFNLKQKKLIEGNIILGRGSDDVFIEKTITLSPLTDPIWKITKVISTAEVTKLDLISSKAFASGYSYIDINYKTCISSSPNTVNGTIQYLHLIVPFSTCINLISDSDDKINKYDCCQTSNIFVSEIHKLNKPTTLPSGEIIYNELTEQFVIQIKVLVTRLVKLYI